MLNKNNLKKELEQVLNMQLPGGDDFHKEAEIKKKNKKVATGLSDAINKFVKRF